MRFVGISFQCRCLFSAAEEIRNNSADGRVVAVLEWEKQMQNFLDSNETANDANATRPTARVNGLVFRGFSFPFF